MDIIQRGIITLIKSALTQQALPLPEGFDIEIAYPEIQKHNITSLAYDGAVRCGISRQAPGMQKLFQGSCRLLMISEGQMEQVRRIFEAFDENGIDYMPLKGCKMKGLYPKPELRVMGDADILIRMEQYQEKIVPLMRSLGFQEKSESDHELVWRNDALYLELHKRLIPSYNEDYYAYYGDGWKLATRKHGSRYSMTAEDEMIYLFTHFSKHYRDGGIGCRHVADLWVYREANPNLDENYIQRELEKLQLLEFYQNICRLLDVWFGNAAADDKVDFMTDYIFASGSWGKMESRTLSRAVRDSSHSVLGFSGRLLYIWQTLFPGVDVLKEKYTILKKAPWTLPLVWLVRPFYKVLFERKTLKRQKINLDNLSQDNMQLRKQMLNYVGLDYHF